ncbi:hypothetical protein OG884_35485 [Streptosporangium sp. NBC_01755]|uniref:hypothetical protein n=1 Tax=unclassified Streptosporangium TaxID=2632669 RepID=UPI002DD7C9A8|nr:MULTISPECIES: hypothetical protein [unclassified Streptosporangium]WSA28493.1 hypothetical protein OIE13_11780 [Streptosporangium sp. NBC_01810]WSD04300.1 hypothetical protein OG884_35485 [Streptosporangium sp. NBC_01755]
MSKDDLIGAGADGQVHTSEDAGESRQAVGRLPGRASAFTAVDRRRLLAAMEDGTIVESTDGGGRFSVVYRPASK